MENMNQRLVENNVHGHGKAKNGLTENVHKEILDLASIIPPPNPLPTTTFSSDESLTVALIPRCSGPLCISPITTKDAASESATSSLTVPTLVSTFKEESTNSPKAKASRRAEFRLNIQKFIENSLTQSGIDGLYILESSNVYSSAIVYSRNGKSRYGSMEKSLLNINFEAKDLQKILQQQSKPTPPYHKWSFMPPSAKIEPYYQPSSGSDKTLVFESRFESGNLELSIKVNNSEYYLLMQNDTLTKGHTQWFYFKVSNTTQGMPVRFHILNFSKKDSLYTQGMKVAAFSAVKNEWFRTGTDICYAKNNYGHNQKKEYYSLSFTHTFEFSNDTVSFAYSYPYLYSDLQQFLAGKCLVKEAQRYIARRTLCKTIAGYNCEVLTITSQKENKKKQGVILTARVHPGETVSSWILHGAIDFLLSDDPVAKDLRDNFVFRIVPMLNPDGVIQGNYRSSLAGCDLNRRYLGTLKTLHPTVYALKKMAVEFNKQYPVVLYCDFHGHSKNKGVFAYGNNNNEQNPEKYRIYPYMLSKICPFFSYKASSFGMQKGKSSTARVVMWKELNIPSVYTIEASFYGSLEGEHFSIEDLKEIGKNVCQAIQPFTQVITRDSRSEVITEIISNIPSFKTELVENNEEESESGSDSSPSDDNMDPKELNEIISPVLSDTTVQKKYEVEKEHVEPRTKELPMFKTKYKFPWHEFWKWERRKCILQVVDAWTQTDPEIEEPKNVVKRNVTPLSEIKAKDVMFKRSERSLTQCETQHYNGINVKTTPNPSPKVKPGTAIVNTTTSIHRSTLKGREATQSPIKLEPIPIIPPLVRPQNRPDRKVRKRGFSQPRGTHLKIAQQTTINEAPRKSQKITYRLAPLQALSKRLDKLQQNQGPFPITSGSIFSSSFMSKLATKGFNETMFARSASHGYYHKK